MCIAGKCDSKPLCQHEMFCANGGSYKSCATNTTAYYQASDGKVFQCASTSDCDAAAADVVAWCNTKPCRASGGACGNSNECCSGLVCAAGACTNGSASTVTWTIVDECNDGDTIDYAFFDLTDKVSAWPPGAGIFYNATFGNSYEWKLVCATNDKICVGGADDHNMSAIYGVGTDGSQSCSNCCFACTTRQVTFTFTCP